MATLTAYLPSANEAARKYRELTKLEVQQVRKILAKHLAPGTYRKVYAEKQTKCYRIKFFDLVYCAGARDVKLVDCAITSSIHELRRNGWVVKADWDGVSCTFKILGKSHDQKA